MTRSKLPLISIIGYNILLIGCKNLIYKAYTLLTRIKIFLYRTWAKWKSYSTHPESIELDLLSLLTKRQPIRVAIIDDQHFPFINALEAEGCFVKYFVDYSRKTSKKNDKQKLIDLKNFDIIICDIHNIGAQIYPKNEGISVLEDLRLKHPLKVILAYTADPGIIFTKLKQADTLDKTFAKEWEVDDFLFNFREILDIFTKPKNRWEFIQRRLTHLGLAQQKINTIQKVFVEHVLLFQKLSTLPTFNEAHTLQVISDSASRIDLKTPLVISVKAIEIAQIFLPLIVGNK